MAAVKTSIFMIINWDNKLDRLLIIFIIQAVEKYPIVPLIFFTAKNSSKIRLIHTTACEHIKSTSYHIQPVFSASKQKWCHRNKSIEPFTVFTNLLKTRTGFPFVIQCISDCQMTIIIVFGLDMFVEQKG